MVDKISVIWYACNRRDRMIRVIVVGVVPKVYRRGTAWLDEYEWFVYGVAYVSAVLAVVLAFFKRFL